MGMKTGAGEDPFADDEDEVNGGVDGGTEGTEDSGGRAASGRRDRRRDRSTRGDRDPSARGEGERSDREDAPGDDVDGRVQPSELPFIARRNARGDNVKAGRETRRLFELRPDVAEQEEAFLDELARNLDGEVPKTDAREAALAVVYDRPDLVTEKLEEWGFNYFEE